MQPGTYLPMLPSPFLTERVSWSHLSVHIMRCLLWAPTRVIPINRGKVLLAQDPVQGPRRASHACWDEQTFPLDMSDYPHKPPAPLLLVEDRAQEYKTRRSKSRSNGRSYSITHVNEPKLKKANWFCAMGTWALITWASSPSAYRTLASEFARLEGGLHPTPGHLVEINTSPVTARQMTLSLLMRTSQMDHAHPFPAVQNGQV